MFSGPDGRNEVDDTIVSRMVTLLESVRGRSHRVEIEMRLGRFASDSRFQPGFGSRELANRLVASLQRNCAMKPGWSAIDPVMFQTGHYADDIRKRTTNGIAEVIRKTRIAHLDIGSNREFGLRFALNEESPVMNHRADVDPPLLQSVTERASFIETLQLSPDFSIRVRYDISKQSQRKQTKIELEEDKADFHCEIELCDPLHSEPKSLEKSRLIAMALLYIGRACMGTHYAGPTGKVKILPPTLFLLK